MESFGKVAMAAAGFAVGYMYGEWSIMLQVLLGLSVADYITGLIAAGIEGATGADSGLSSKKGFKGIGKKIVMFVIVAAAHFADRMLGGSNSMVMDAAIFFYAGNELLSLVENAGRSGVPVPYVLKKAIEVLRSKGGETNEQK